MSEKLSPQGVSYDSLPHIVNADGQRLFAKYWDRKFKDGKTNPRALVFIAHGLAEHILPYNVIGEPLEEQGILTFGHDHVGHGQSEGDRVHIDNWKTYTNDIHQHCDMMRDKYPDVPIFIIGHSLGGAMAVLAALERPKYFQGVVLIAPTIIPNPETSTPFRICVAKTLARIWPQFQIAKLPPESISRDKEVVKKYEEDPLVWHGGIKTKFAVLTLKALHELESNLSSVEFPFLTLHGDQDLLADIGSSKELHELASSKDKTFKIYEGYYHQLHYEPGDDGKQVIKTMIDWITDRIDGQASY